MKPLNEIKTRALQSGRSEARVVFNHVNTLEGSRLDVDQIEASLNELISWAEEFKKGLVEHKDKS